MRVLMFGWEFPPYQAGGLATATLGLVKGLLGRRVQVTLVVPFPVSASEVEGARLVSTAGRKAKLTRYVVNSPLLPYMSASSYEATALHYREGTRGAVLYGRNLFEEVERFAEIATEVAREEPHDVIHAHDWITYRAGMRAKRASGRPLVVHIHATEFDRSGDFVNEEICAREREGMDAADFVIANSGYLKRLVTTRYRIPEEKVFVVHWGIDDEEPEKMGGAPRPFAPDEPVVLFLGRVTRQKGPDYFIEMARRVVELLPKTRFIVAGAGDMLHGMIERAVDLGLSERVHFTGALEQDDVRRVFRLADVCVMTSVSEPFGLVALESVRSGTPCIVPKESGVAEVLHNAFKVDFWDIEELTNKVVGILKHPELHAEMQERGREEISSPRLGLDHPAREVAAIYAEAVHSAGPTEGR